MRRHTTASLSACTLGSARAMLAVAMMLAPQATGQTVINLSASVYCSSSGQWLNIPMSPGIYDIAPVGPSGGGLYTAFNPFQGRVSNNCSPEGQGCYEGWLCDYAYYFDGDPAGWIYGVNSNGYPFFRTPEHALAAANPIRITVGSATVYHFRVGSGIVCNDNVGGVSLLLSPCLALSAHPQSVSCCPGGTATFSAAAIGSGAITYHWQWRRVDQPEWHEVVGGTNADGVASFGAATRAAQQLEITDVQEGGWANSERLLGRVQFACVATNTCGSVWSRPAAVYVAAADVGTQGGQPGQDGQLDNNDFVVFIDDFFSSRSNADLGRQGGAFGPDGLFDNNDFIVFIDEFFRGC